MKRLTCLLIAIISSFVLSFMKIYFDHQLNLKFGDAVFPRRPPCREVFEIQNCNHRSKNGYVHLACEELRKAKEKNAFISSDIYHILGSEGLNNVEMSPISGTSDKLNVSIIPYESILDKLEWEVPFLPCKLKKYTGEDVKTCLNKRLKSGKKTKISYVGDSRIRHHMETLLDLLRSYSMNIITANGESITLDDFLGLKGRSEWIKYKNRLKISSSDLPGLFIEFTWAPILHKGDQKPKESFTSLMKYRQRIPLKRPKQSLTMKNITTITEGAMDVLRRKALEDNEQLPDIMLLDSGTWELQSMSDILENIDQNVVEGLGKLRPILEDLSKRTSVVMMLPEPFKEYVFSSMDAYYNYHTLQQNHNLEWYLNGQKQLIPKDVQVWDSFLPFAYAIMDDCIDIVSHEVEKLPPYSRFEPSSSFSCGDRVHIGYRTVYVGVQEMLNHLCNEYVVDKELNNYCCVA